MSSQVGGELGIHDPDANHAKPLTIVLPPDTVGLLLDLFKKVLHWNPNVESLQDRRSPSRGLWKDAITRPLKNLEFIAEFVTSMYAWASFDQAIGDEVINHTRLIPLIGSTEGSLQNYTIALGRKLWNTFDYCPEAPHRWVKRAGHGEELYELVFDRPADGRPSYYGGTLWNARWYRHVDVVETRELYSPVTDLDGATWWVFRMRADDLTKLSFLTKFNATHIKARVRSKPAVRHVLIGGEDRPAPYVLVDLKDGVAGGARSADEVLDDIHNEIRTPPETVFLAKKEKHLKINLRALVLRRELDNEYKEEIDEVYRNFEPKKRKRNGR